MDRKVERRKDIMRRQLWTLFAIVMVVAILVSAHSEAEVLTLQDVNSTGILDNSPVDGVGDSLYQTLYDVGIYMTSGINAHSVFAFQMTGVADPSQITDANFSVTARSITGTPDFGIDAYVARSSSSAAILASDYQDTTLVANAGFPCQQHHRFEGA
jgi:hypothetical protein